MLISSILLVFSIGLDASADLININTASSGELQNLSGIGETYAQRIIEYRNTNGDFKIIEEIKNVSGIGEVTFGKIKSSITIGDNQATDEGEQVVEDINDVDYSTHYNSTKLEDSEVSIVSRDRVVSVGSPVEFGVEGGEFLENKYFDWNFGDGTGTQGKSVSHAYEFSGEYVVVLNARIKNQSNVSRINVRVIEPDIEITEVNDVRIELHNKSKEEINLYGRGLYMNGQIFAIPKDTIVRSGAKISFSSKTTGFTVIDRYSTKLVVVGKHLNHEKISEINRAEEQKKNMEIDRIKSELASLQTAMASKSKVQYSVSENGEDVSSSPVGFVKEENLEENDDLEVNSMDANVEGKKLSWLEILKMFFLNK